MQMYIPVYDPMHLSLDIYFLFMQKFWPDCPHEIVLVCGEKEYKPQLNMPNITVKVLGKNLDWSSHVLDGMEYIDDVFLMCLEDYILCSPVDNKFVSESYDFMITNPNVGCIRMHYYEHPQYNRLYHTIADDHNDDYGRLKKIEYYLSMQQAYWRKDCLAPLLVRGESAWDAEMVGSSRAWKSPYDFLCVKLHNMPIHYLLAVGRGKWIKSNMARLQALIPEVALPRKGKLFHAPPL